LGVVLVAGLVVIPEIGQQSALADKGGAPNEHASDKARGHCSIGIFYYYEDSLLRCPFATENAA